MNHHETSIHTDIDSYCERHESIEAATKTVERSAAFFGISSPLVWQDERKWNEHTKTNYLLRRACQKGSDGVLRLVGTIIIKGTTP